MSRPLRTSAARTLALCAIAGALTAAHGIGQRLLHEATGPGPALPPVVGRANGMGTTPSSRSQLERVSADGSNLFRALFEGWGRVPVAGTRTFSQFVEGQIYRYHESLVVEPAAQSRNEPRFSLELQKVEQIGDRTYEVTLRKKAWELRVGFLHHYRDFRVHDPVRANKNYTVTPMGSVFRNLRKLFVFDVKPRNPALSSYRILVDQQLPIVLDQMEFGHDGRVISALFYDTLLLGPAAKAKPGIQWWQPWMPVLEHATVEAATERIGLRTTVLREVADGFGLATIRTTQQPARQKDYLVLVYTDGIDSRFLLTSKSSTLAPEVPIGPNDPPPLVPVKRYRLGPVTQYLVDHAGKQYLVIGTFPETGVPRMLEQVVR